MSHTVIVFVLTLARSGMLLFLEIGRRAASRRLRDDSGRHAGGDRRGRRRVFAVLGLLIAFTFSGAAARSTRAELDRRETNDIGTATSARPAPR